MTTLMSVFLLPKDASCRLIGEADLGYVNYESSVASQSVSAHSLTQRYSVLYDASGKLVNGRLGKYEVALGYEFLTFDTGIKSSSAPSENVGESKGHLYYNGELLLDPKEIPFRLKIYSRDLNRSTFSTNMNSGGQNINGNIFDAPSINGAVSDHSSYIALPSNTVTGIYGGTHSETGATLVAGVKNGMTNGYNEILRHFPMLMLDYRDIINKDHSNLYPVDNRLSRLAFVSLNKKDNWFHYRYVTFEDYIERSNNYNETQLQLGTVDHLLQRRWIDFANWLRVSADGQLTKRNNEKSSEDFEEFSLNLFGIARRQSWEVSTFNNFTRLNETNRDRLVYKTSLPVYASGIIDPTAKWSAFTKYDDSHTEKGEYFTTAAGGYNIDSFSRSSFTLSQGLNVEQVNNSSGQSSLIVSGNVGTTSTPIFARDLSLNAAYSIKNYHNTNNSGSSNFLDQEIKGNIGYNLTNKLRIMVGQSNNLTIGTSQIFSNSDLGVTINSPQYQASRESTSLGNSSGFRSITDFKIDWIPKPRLNVGLLVSEDIYSPTSGRQSAITKAYVSVDYTESKFRITSKSSLFYYSVNNIDNANRFLTTNDVNYIFSRNLDAKIGFSYLKTFHVTDQSETISAQQSLNYNYYQTSGFSRKLFEINESFSSVGESVSSTALSGVLATTKQRVNTFLLGAKYFPLRQMMIAAGARYSFVNRSENESLGYYGSLSMSYQLLEASLDYTYGKNKVDNRVEKRLSANLKKKF